MPLSDAHPAPFAMPHPIAAHYSNPTLKRKELSCAVGVASAAGSAL